MTDALVHLLPTAPDMLPVRKELLTTIRSSLQQSSVRECAPHYPPPMAPLQSPTTAPRHLPACRCYQHHQDA